MSDNLTLKINECGIEHKTNIIRPNETTYIKCSNCSKNLICIAPHKLADKTFYKMVVECPFCGDKSFEYDVKGTVGVRPCEGVGLVDIKRDDKKMTNLYKTRLI